MVDWQGVSLCVEHPVVQGQHVIFTEQKIEVPGAIRQGWAGRRWTQRDIKGNSSGTPSTHKQALSAGLRWRLPLASAATVYGDTFPDSLPHSPAGNYHPWGKGGKTGWASALSRPTNISSYYQQRQICTKGQQIQAIVMPPLYVGH